MAEKNRDFSKLIFYCFLKIWEIVELKDIAIAQFLD